MAFDTSGNINEFTALGQALADEWKQLRQRAAKADIPDIGREKVTRTQQFKLLERGGEQMRKDFLAQGGSVSEYAAWLRSQRNK